MFARSPQVMNQPKVSVVVAVFNQERFIGRCLRSLMQQTLDNSDYEIVVIDDGSFDRTGYALEQFCDPFDSFIRLITNETNKGLAYSANLGIEASLGEYIVRVDSDDYVNRDFLKCLLVYLELNESDAVACDYVVTDDQEKFIARGDAMQNPIACGILFQKKCLLDVGCYDSEMLLHEERELRSRFETKYRVDHLRIPLYRYRRHDKNMTNDGEKMHYYDQILKSKMADHGN